MQVVVLICLLASMGDSDRQALTGVR